MLAGIHSFSSDTIGRIYGPEDAGRASGVFPVPSDTAVRAGRVLPEYTPSHQTPSVVLAGIHSFSSDAIGRIYGPEDAGRAGGALPRRRAR